MSRPGFALTPEARALLMLRDLTRYRDEPRA
jgi:hypothetical protein